MLDGDIRRLSEMEGTQVIVRTFDSALCFLPHTLLIPCLNNVANIFKCNQTRCRETVHSRQKDPSGICFIDVVRSDTVGAKV